MAFSLIVSRIKIKSARDTDDHYDFRQGYFIQFIFPLLFNFLKCCWTFFSNVSLQIVHLIDFYNTFAYCTIKKYLEDN